jgi:hypothetical protein
VVPEALGNKIIHPYSDFLLHDIGTGDGIVQAGPQDTAEKTAADQLSRNSLISPAPHLTSFTLQYKVCTDEAISNCRLFSGGCHGARCPAD